MEIAEFFSSVIGIIVTIYVAFVIISQLSQQTPEFSYYGWLMFGALIIGALAVIIGLFKKN
jgi:hypothetical protein